MLVIAVFLGAIVLAPTLYVRNDSFAWTLFALVVIAETAIQAWRLYEKFFQAGIHPPWMLIISKKQMILSGIALITLYQSGMAVLFFIPDRLEEQSIQNIAYLVLVLQTLFILHGGIAPLCNHPTKSNFSNLDQRFMLAQIFVELPPVISIPVAIASFILPKILVKLLVFAIFLSIACLLALGSAAPTSASTRDDLIIIGSILNIFLLPALFALKLFVISYRDANIIADKSDCSAANLNAS